MELKSAAPVSCANGPADSAYSKSVEELRAIASALAENKDVISHLESILSEELGFAVRHVRSETIIPPVDNLTRYISSRRTQSKHWVSIPEGTKLPRRLCNSVRDGCLTIFLKAGRRIRNLAVDALLNNVETSDAYFPRYFGSFEAADRMLAAWEAVEGEHIAFDALSPRSERNLVEAVAELNAIPASEFASILPNAMRWVFVSGDYYEEIYGDRMDADQREQWRSVLAETTTLVREGGDLDLRVRRLRGGLLSHNDINRNNVLFSKTGRVAIFDWEGASLGFAGADLRFLARVKNRDALIDCYADRINALGVQVAREDVLAGYAIAEGMRKVHRGWAVMSIAPVENGLALVKSVLDR